MTDKEKIELLVKALEFYADPLKHKDEFGYWVPVPDFYDEMDFGERARNAIEAVRT